MLYYYYVTGIWTLFSVNLHQGHSITQLILALTTTDKFHRIMPIPSIANGPIYYRYSRQIRMLLHVELADSVSLWHAAWIVVENNKIKGWRVQHHGFQSMSHGYNLHINNSRWRFYLGLNVCQTWRGNVAPPFNGMQVHNEAKLDIREVNPGGGRDKLFIIII